MISNLSTSSKARSLVTSMIVVISFIVAVDMMFGPRSVHRLATMQDSQFGNKWFKAIVEQFVRFGSSSSS